MRKTIFISIFILVFLCFLLIMNFGFKLGPIKILSYDEIDECNFKKKILAKQLDEKINIEYKNKEKELNSITQNYKNLKSEYESKINAGIIKANAIEQSLNICDFNEINSIVQKYAKEKNIELEFDVNNSENNYEISSDYIICDFSFKIKGEYIDITDYIYSLEDDDRLNFEINNFELKKSDETLVATFNVKNIPILSSSL